MLSDRKRMSQRQNATPGDEMIIENSESSTRTYAPLVIAALVVIATLIIYQILAD